MYNLNLSLVQCVLTWHDKQKNLDHIESLINNHSSKSQVYLLPEMFPTGFTMDTDAQAETMDGRVIHWMKKLAVDQKAVISGSLIIKENNNYFNRLIWVQPDGMLHHYDKRHLFSYAKEDQYFTAGQKKCIIEYQGWRICPLICYDLRFPVWSRNTEQYDFLFYVANWPEKRAYAWNTLLKARAVENLAYCAGVNRVGVDGNGISYNGCSTILQFDGEILKKDHHQEEILHFELDKSKLNAFRDRFKFLSDQDQFEVEI